MGGKAEPEETGQGDKAQPRKPLGWSHSLSLVKHMGPTRARVEFLHLHQIPTSHSRFQVQLSPISDSDAQCLWQGQETDSHSVAQAGPDFTVILLPQPLKQRDYRHKPSHQTYSHLSLRSTASLFACLLNVWVFCLSVSLWMCMPGAYRKQKRM